MDDMTDYTSVKKLNILPRLPLSGSIDLTYRCNNNCRHCWLIIPPGDQGKQNELSFEEICHIVDDARAMGCRQWAISGGEPMLRPDFPEIFDYLTSHSSTYSINSNGTLITPGIAELMKRKGNKMIALYGATEAVHDHVTRHPGSFQATMRGFDLLKEAGAGFTVQIIPMKDNYHEYPAMVELAESLSPHWRVGAPWLYLSASGNPEKNVEIDAQRLSPCDVVELDRPNVSVIQEEGIQEHPLGSADDDRFFDACIIGRREFHVDSYGMLSFCCFIKDPAMRYDLRRGTFRDGWERFIPSLAGRVRGGDEYLNNCGSCNYRKDCRWCPVYGYLEHGRYSAKVEHLCDVARENRTCKETMIRDQRRYFQIGGITIQVDSDLPFSETTFDPKFASFRTDGPGEDTVSIHHHFSLPNLPEEKRGEELYRKSPWAIYRKGGLWIYAGIPTDGTVSPLHRLAVFSEDYTSGKIYNDPTRGDNFRAGNIGALTMFPSDQILIARLLADRKGYFLHSSGAVMDEKGLLFVGHSEAGKSTIARMIMPHAEILCDDRNIVRRHEDGWRVYGTWCHGDVPNVSSRSAPLHAVHFIEKSEVNRITRIDDRRKIIRRLLACVIRPFETADWWEKTLTSIEQMAREVPCYQMQFDMSGAIVGELKSIW
ncbi:MAG: radical SAM protein [Methanoregula sp.]|nr:radical SAM protein [Methanoregula sp.]